MTFLLSSIVKALEERGRKVAATASTGIATTHSWAGMYSINLIIVFNNLKKKIQIGV